jgi:hypothetical protein
VGVPAGGIGTAGFGAMREADADSESGSLSVNEKAPRDITPEMIEAGYNVLVKACITDDPLEADRLVVSDIFRAMDACSSHPRFRSERN